MVWGVHVAVAIHKGLDPVLYYNPCPGLSGWSHDIILVQLLGGLGSVGSATNRIEHSMCSSGADVWGIGWHWSADIYSVRIQGCRATMPYIPVTVCLHVLPKCSTYLAVTCYNACCCSASCGAYRCLEACCAVGTVVLRGGCLGRPSGNGKFCCPSCTYA